MKRQIIFLTILALIVPCIVSATSEIDEGSELAMMVFKTVIYIVIFIMVIIFAIYGTKFFAKKSQSFMKSKYIHIIDSVSIGQNTKLIIAKISNNIYIISLNNNQVTLIDKISTDTFVSNIDKSDFDQYFNHFIDEKRNNNINSLKFKDKIKDFLENIKSTEIDKEEEKNEKNS